MRAVVPLAAGLAALACGSAAGAEPVDAAGNVGATSYENLPFETDVFRPSWGGSLGLEPAQLFFEANPASPYNDVAAMRTARRVAAGIEAAGAVPAGNNQRWEDTFAASFPPGTFAGAPAFVTREALAHRFDQKPEFVAWRDFIVAHPQYWDLADDGGPMPGEAYYRAWGGQWGHISPLTPLDAADCPPDMPVCTWGDAYAARWARSSARSGAYGLILSDFSDAQPDRPSTFQDFNPRIVSAFAAAYPALRVPGGTVPEQAKWIVGNAFLQWNDHVAAGYARFYAALARRVGAATHRRALVIDQCAETPSYRRLVGNDERILAVGIAPGSFMCTWDDHVVQIDRPWPVVAPPVGELAGFAIGAAREPGLRNGANLEADDAAYWRAIGKFYPGLDGATQREVGEGLLKRLWLWAGWAHIAGRDGHVRRALAYTTRDYWDTGSLAALDPLAALLRGIVPTRPFGPALYYSVAVERAREEQNGRRAGPGRSVPTYLPPAALQAYVDGGGVLGYYVSDVALGHIAAHGDNAPSAWVVIGGPAALPPAERQALAAVAPIVATPAEAAALAGQPLTLSAGLAGFGFYDQTGRLVLVVSNPSTLPTAAAVAGSIRLAWAGRAARVRDLFAGTERVLAASGGALVIPVALARWDTAVFAVLSAAE